MMDRLMLIGFFALAVGGVWMMSALSTPHRGFTRVLEKTAAGAVLCLVCFALLAPLGIHVPLSPLSALLAGYFGLPGAAFSAFVAIWP